MKKIIIALVLVTMLFGSNVASAQVSSQDNVQVLQRQYQVLIMKLIELLTQRIAELQAQLSSMQAAKVQAPIVNQLTTPVEPIVNQPATVASSTPQIAATSTTAAAPAPQYTPTIRLEIVGTKVVWQAAGERFDCKLNGESVWQEGSKEANGITAFTLGCVGTVTGSRVEKTIQ